MGKADVNRDILVTDKFGSGIADVDRRREKGMQEMTRKKEVSQK